MRLGHWSSPKRAELGCSWEHLAEMCPQVHPGYCPRCGEDGGAGDAAKPGRAEQDPHRFLYKIPGQMRPFRTQLPGRAAPSRVVGAPWLLGDCLGLPSLPGGALAASTLFSWLPCAWSCTGRVTGSALLISLEFAVSCSVDGDLPSTCFEIKLIKLEQS